MADGRPTKSRIMPPGHWDWPLPTTFSQGWRVGNLIFVGGQISQSPDGTVRHPYDIERQIESKEGEG